MTNIKKIYYGLVSLVSIISLAISFWMFLSAIGKYVFISPDEYIASHKYEVDRCERILKEQIKDKEIEKNTSDDEKILAECKKNTEKTILLKRNYNLKITLISSISSFVVFLIVFIFHYRQFRKIE